MLFFQFGEKLIAHLHDLGKVVCQPEFVLGRIIGFKDLAVKIFTVEIVKPFDKVADIDFVELFPKASFPVPRVRLRHGSAGLRHCP